MSNHNLRPLSSLSGKLVLNAETCYPVEQDHNPVYAAYKADRLGYQFVACGWLGKIYAIIRIQNNDGMTDTSLYLAELETDKETTEEIIQQYYEYNGIEH